MSERPTTEPSQPGRIYDPQTASTQSYQATLVLAMGWLVTLCAARLFLPLGMRTTTIAMWMGVVLSIGVAIVIDRWLPPIDLRRLRTPLQARCESIYGVDLSEATFVGASPAVYSTDYDLGFLMVEPGVMRYFGERASFGLYSEQVLRVLAHPRQTGQSPRVDITWRETKVSAWRQFSLTVREPVLAKDVQSLTESLAARIEEWAHSPARDTGVQIQMPGFTDTTDAELSRGPGYSCSGLAVAIMSFAVCAVIVNGLAALLYGDLSTNWTTLRLLSPMVTVTGGNALIEWVWAWIRRKSGRKRQPDHG